MTELQMAEILRWFERLSRTFESLDAALFRLQSEVHALHAETLRATRTSRGELDTFRRLVKS